MLAVPRMMIRLAWGVLAIALVVIVVGCDAARVPIPDREAVELQSVDRLSPRLRSAERLMLETRRPSICNVESIAGVSGADLGGDVVVTPPFMIAGWAYFAAGAEATNSVWLRFKTGESENSKAIEHPIFQTRDRPDVANVLNIPGALRSGFVLRLEALKPGEYVIEIVFDAGPERVVCAHSRRIRVVAQ